MTAIDPAVSRQVAWFAEHVSRLADNVERLVRGKREQVELAVLCLLAEGHLLVEDVPGVGKTTLARALAESIGGVWHRIQFTPDLLPGDVTGVSVYRSATGTFEFQPGPVFAHVVVADEINRASPKTQSALLEVMEEQQVTVDGTTHVVPRPFLVLATQNPVELAGTYRLPEAQLDRFLVRLHLGYPDVATEADLLVGARPGPRPHVGAVTDPETVEQLIAVTDEVLLAPAVATYIARIAAATRAVAGVRLGASPRASIGLARLAKAAAAADGRVYVTPGDVQRLAPAVLAHRLVLEREAEAQGFDGGAVVERVLDTVPAPRPR